MQTALASNVVSAVRPARAGRAVTVAVAVREKKGGGGGAFVRRPALARPDPGPRAGATHGVRLPGAGAASGGRAGRRAACRVRPARAAAPPGGSRAPGTPAHPALRPPISS